MPPAANCDRGMNTDKEWNHEREE